MNLRRTRVGLCIAVTFVAAGSALSVRASPPPAPPAIPPAISPASPPAQANPPRNPQLGLVHVDNMDLHAVRLPDAPPVDREKLGAADIADRYRRAAESGAGWHRWSFYWDLVERSGQHNWGVTDGIVARDVAHGLSTLAVVQGMPPGVVHLTGAPEGTDRPIFTRKGGGFTDDPAEAAGVNPDNFWARFVGAVVQRYRPGGDLGRERGWGAGSGIRAWEIGNEPNLRSFWRGTPAEYARYLEVGYLVTKWLDPQATVMHGGIADDGNAQGWYGAFLDALKSRAAASPLPARYNYYFDKSAWHWYRSPFLLDTGPDRARAMLAERGLPPKPIWVTEAGLPVWNEHPGPCWDPASPGRATVAEQAGYIWQALAEGLAHGVETIFYFQLYDDCGNGEASYDAFGLVRNHAANQCWTPPGQGCWSADPALAGTPRPSYAAFQLAARELAGARLVQQVPAAAGGSRRIVFTRPGARVTIAWNSQSGARTVPIEAASGAATVYSLDAAGKVVTQRLAASGGAFNVALPGITNHNGIGGRAILAGRPVIVVEGGTAAVAAGAAGPGASGSAGPATGGSAGPATGGSAGSGSAPGAAAMPPGAVPPDRTPPILAVVAPLPATSPPKFELTVLSGDDGSGLDAFLVHWATGAVPPRSAKDWSPLGTVRPWPGRPKAGQIQIPFEGKPGQTYHFAAQAGDRAGNWTLLPAYAQAATRIAVGAGGGVTPGSGPRVRPPGPR